MERLQSDDHVVGLKQSKKAIESGRARLVYISKDAEGHITAPVERMCRERGIKVVYAESMKELAKACRVDVPTAVAVLV